MNAFNEDFDINNPYVDIPNEVADHIDNDFDLAYSAPDVSAEWGSALCKPLRGCNLEDQHTKD